jgi:hypothetical protein
MDPEARMSRRYTEQVEVHLGEPLVGELRVSAERLGPVGVVPTAFIWRGRLHVVRAVLDHWTQRLPWWRLAWAEDASPGDRAAGLEQDVWRVEASAGRLLGSGVYDLAHDERWRLVRVAD